MTRVLVVDDHPLMREAMRMVTGELFADLEFHEAESCDAAEAAFRTGRFDLVLLDLCMPGAGGMDAVLRMGETAPDTPLIVISHLDDPDTVRQVIACGAAGFVPKSHSKELIAKAIRVVMDGGISVPPHVTRAHRTPAATADDLADDETGPLTRRQKVVLNLLTRGCSNKQIARELNISEWTVKAHVNAVLRKLGVNSRMEAVVAVRPAAGNAHPG